MHGRRASGAEPARELFACAERALAAPSARIELHREFSWPQAEWPRPCGWRGNVLRLVAKGGKLLIRTGGSCPPTDTLHGTACRRLAAHVDRERASAATEEGLRPPPVERLEQLRALPLTAWIDGQHVRRIRFGHGTPARHLTTLELWDAGVPVAILDWSPAAGLPVTGLRAGVQAVVSAGPAAASRARGSRAARSPQ